MTVWRRRRHVRHPPGKFTIGGVHRIKPASDFQVATHISIKNRYVFFQVSKAASSTVTYHLQTREFEGSHFKVQDPNNKYVSPHLSPYQLSHDDLCTIMNSTEFRKVAFVRNPFTRVLSCYLHRIVGAPDSASATAFRLASGDEKTPSFARFVEVICLQSSLDMERHWRVQSDEILAGMIDHDFIGHFEHLRADLERLGVFLWGNTFDSKALAEINSSPMVTNSNGRLREFYTDSLREMVTERFAADFEVFGYSTELSI